MQLLILSFICIYIYLFFKRGLWFVCARKEKRGKERRGDMRREEKRRTKNRYKGREKGEEQKEKRATLSPHFLLCCWSSMHSSRRSTGISSSVLYIPTVAKKKGRKKKWSYICCPVYSEHSGPSTEFNAHLAPLYSPLVHAAQSSYWGGFLSALFTVAVN